MTSAPTSNPMGGTMDKAASIQPAIHRQITRCTQPATRISTQSQHWELWVCDRHRHLAPKLMGSTYINYRRLRPVEGDPLRCGTLHDRQPIKQAIWSHTRIWLTTPGQAGDDWLQRLRDAADHAAYVRSAAAGDLAEIVKVAASGPGDPAVQRRVLVSLAEAEAKHVPM